MVAQRQSFSLLLAHNSPFDKKISWAGNYQVYQTQKLSEKRIYKSNEN